MIRVATQALLGLMFLFGVLTLLPRAVGCVRMGYRGRGGLYFAISLVLLFLTVLSFNYAYSGWAGR